MDSTHTIDTLRLLGPTSPVRSLHAVDSAAPRCVWVRRISPALDFYLAAGSTVFHAADGRVELGISGISFVLAHGPDPEGFNGSTVPELSTPDLAAVCRRLRVLGVEVGSVRHAPDAPGGRITVRDPDRHTVMITQAEPVLRCLPAATARGRRARNTLG